MRVASLVIAGCLVALAVYFLLRGAGAPEQQAVYDDAILFHDESLAQMETYHRHLLKNYGIDFRVLTTEDAGDLNMLSARKFRELGAGSRSKPGRGALFTVNVKQDKVRVEISAGLEGIYTDAFVSYIERNMMVPYFQGGQVAEGIMAATELFVNRAQESGEGLPFDAAKMPSYTTGAGAVAKARLAEPLAPQRPAEPGATVAGPAELSPQQGVALLMEMLARKEMIYDPLLFTKDSIAVFSRMPMPPAAVDTMRRTYAACAVDAEKIAGDYAVVRFRPEDRRCGPFFFRREDGRWKFDLISIRQIIIYDFQNRWMLKREDMAPYAFAFADWDMRSGKKYLAPKTEGEP